MKVIGHRKTEKCPACKELRFCEDCGLCAACGYTTEPELEGLSIDSNGRLSTDTVNAPGGLA